MPGKASTDFPRCHQKKRQKPFAQSLFIRSVQRLRVRRFENHLQPDMDIATIAILMISKIFLPFILNQSSR
jgi:hypothetical protein